MIDEIVKEVEDLVYKAKIEIAFIHDEKGKEIVAKQYFDKIITLLSFAKKLNDQSKGR